MPTPVRRSRADSPTSSRPRVVPPEVGPLADEPGRADLRGLARLCAFATLLGLVTLALLHLTPSLSLPVLEDRSTLISSSTWSTWFARVGPAGLLMGVVRLAALGLAGHLLVVVTVELLGRATGLVRLQAMGARISTPLTRRLVAQVAGLGVAATVTLFTVAPAAPAPAQPMAMQATAPGSTSSDRTATPTTIAAADPTTTVDGPSAPVMRSLDPEPSAPVMRSLDDGASPLPGPGAPGSPPSGRLERQPDESVDPTAVRTENPTTDSPTMRALDPGSIPSPAAAAPAPSPTRADRSHAPGGGHAADATDTGKWIIQRGDHLWGVAGRTLAGAWHRPPTDAEIARYLDALVAANASVLVVPGDADLVLSGQVFTLPPAPAA
jgi:hypothetical protein